MIYQGPMINPAVEINTAIAGRLLSDASRSTDDALSEAIELYYKPKTPTANEKLVSIYNRAEDAFFENWPEAARKNSARPGELHLEPLFGEHPQKSSYLTYYLDSQGRAEYRKGLMAILKDLSKIEEDFEDEGRIRRIKTCIIAILVDIENLGYDEA